jgi:hypothetical protein
MFIPDYRVLHKNSAKIVILIQKISQPNVKEVRRDEKAIVRVPGHHNKTKKLQMQPQFFTPGFC